MSELSGDLEDTVVALMMKPREYDAKMLHDAIAVSLCSYMMLVVFCIIMYKKIKSVQCAFVGC